VNTNPDDWWLRRRHPPVGPGDAWSGGGKAYRAWMGSGRRRSRSAFPSLFRRRRAQANPRSSTRSTIGVLLSVLTDVPLACFSCRKRLAVTLLVGAGGLAAIIFLVPLAWAHRWDSCAAAELALVDESVGPGSRFEGSKRRVANWAGPDGKLLSRGRVGRQIAAEEHAGWPSFAGCTALFWRVRAEDASFGGLTPVLSRALAARR
jgi:hypothetical protein